MCLSTVNRIHSGSKSGWAELPFLRSPLLSPIYADAECPFGVRSGSADRAAGPPCTRPVYPRNRTRRAAGGNLRGPGRNFLWVWPVGEWGASGLNLPRHAHNALKATASSTTIRSGRKHGNGMNRWLERKRSRSTGGLGTKVFRLAKEMATHRLK